MQESVVVGIVDFVDSQIPEFKKIMDSYYDTETGFTESLQRRLAKVPYNIKEEKWYATMWNFGKPEPLSHRPKIFKAREIQWVNNLGDLVPAEEAQDPITLQPKPGYSAVSPDYRFTIVQSTLNLDFIFNSVDNASLFQELFTLRVYMSRSTYLVLPDIGKCCVYIDEVAMGDIDKFDRLSQGTLLSIPVDMIITYPLIAPVIPPKDQPLYTTERKPLISDIDFDYKVESSAFKRKRYKVDSKVEDLKQLEGEKIVWQRNNSNNQ